MSVPLKAWTFEPLELHQEMTWEVYDPNTAQIVASFHDYDRARQYLAWVNRKQAKKAKKKAENRRASDDFRRAMTSTFG